MKKFKKEKDTRFSNAPMKHSKSKEKLFDEVAKRFNLEKMSLIFEGFREMGFYGDEFRNKKTNKHKDPPLNPL